MVQIQSALICSLQLGAFLVQELIIIKINKQLNIFDKFFIGVLGININKRGI